MAMPVIAAVTVGQSPREDLVCEMRDLLPHARWIQSGALDGMTDQAIAELAPRGDEFPIVTRLTSGRQVLVGHRAILPRLQDAVTIAARDAEIVIVLCSGPLTVRGRVPVLLPDHLLTAAVAAARPEAGIVIVTPSETQIAAQQARWRAVGVEPTIVCATPYGGADFAAIGRQARDQGAGLVVLDCLAYSAAMKASVVAASGLPTILVRSLVARVAGELVA